MRNLTTYISIFFLAAFIAACFHDSLPDAGGQSNPDDIAKVDESKFAASAVTIDMTTADVKLAIKNSLKKGLNDGIYRMSEGATSSSGSISLALKSRSIQNKPAYKALTSPQMKRFLENSVMRKVTGRYNEFKMFPRASADDELEAAIDQLFDDVLDAGVKDGNTVTYRIQESVCDDTDTAEDKADCLEAREHLSLVIVLNSENAGILSLKYDTFVPLSVGYSSDEWFVQISLTDIAATAKQLETDLALTAEEVADIDLPDTFKGAVRMSMQVPDANTVKTAFGIIEAIDIDDTDSYGTKTFLDIAVAEVLNVSVNTATRELSVGTAMNAFTLLLHEVGEQNSTTDYKWGFSGITGTVSVDVENEVITVSDAGLRDKPLYWDIDNQHAFIIEMDTTSFKWDASTSDFSLTFTKGFSFDANFTNLNGEFQDDFFSDANNPEDTTLKIGFAVSAPTGTVVGSSDDDRVRVDAGGPVVAAVTGHNAGSVTINAGQCLTEQVDEFPISETCAADF
ncbi:MAG: hypothetical protein OEZ43_19155 [Gammaproteobacteria bacterium]|nr:hypothetical protein [Gammaproteobacteria bacterium]